jgi:hypothetical protein
MQRRILFRPTWLAAALSLGHHFGPAAVEPPRLILDHYQPPILGWPAFGWLIVFVAVLAITRDPRRRRTSTMADVVGRIASGNWRRTSPATGGQPTINPPTAVARSAAVTGSTRPTHGSGCTARWRELAAPQQPANPGIRVDPARPAPGYEVMHRTVTYGVVYGSRRAPGRWGP